mmetsp:Transcript_146543/g.408244  ORF Transcript_146543/g.408244 Transcript_146543/m.408244 type:complete len:349 (-) Transcript_146543:433-1479(-)
MGMAPSPSPSEGHAVRDWKCRPLGMDSLGVQPGCCRPVAGAAASASASGSKRAKSTMLTSSSFGCHSFQSCEANLGGANCGGPSLPLAALAVHDQSPHGGRGCSAPATLGNGSTAELKYSSPAQGFIVPAVAMSCAQSPCSRSHGDFAASVAVGRRDGSCWIKRLQNCLASSEKRRPKPIMSSPRRPLTVSSLKSTRASISCLMSSWPLRVRNGRRPPNITTYMETPTAHMSAGKPYPSLFCGRRCCSGAMKAGVPHFSLSNMSSGTKVARPKSESFSWLAPTLLLRWDFTMKFSGLTSRWQMPLECKAEMAAQICRIHSAASLSRRLRPRSWILSPKSPPSQYSRAK